MSAKLLSAHTQPGGFIEKKSGDGMVNGFLGTIDPADSIARGGQAPVSSGSQASPPALFRAISAPAA